MSWLFDTSSPMDEVMEKATGEHQSTENWELILHICDAIKSDTKLVKPSITSIKKRLNHRDPHVVILAISVLDSCWANCGATFRREISSREFINELESKCKSSVRQVGEKTRLMIKKWVDSEAKEDDSLSLIRTLYKNLIADGHSFESSEPKKRLIISKDPNVVHSQEEEDDIAKAIALSLNDAPKQNGSGNKSTSTLYPSAMNGGMKNESFVHPSAPAASPSLAVLAARGLLKDTRDTVSVDRAYPSLSLASTIMPKTIAFASPKQNMKNGGGLWPSLPSDSNETIKGAMEGVPRMEKRAFALYDFEAAEDNELSFKTGDDVTITDDSNANWWRGRNERTRAEGLFPSSFVTTNPAEMNAQKTETAVVPSTPITSVVRIDEEQLLKCIALLEDCDPTGAVADPPELSQIEASSLAQAPLIDAALASVDRQSNALAMVDVAIRNVLALYDSAVQQAAYNRYAAPPAMQQMQPMQQAQQQPMPQQQPHPHQQYYMQQAAAAAGQPPMQHPQMQPQQQYAPPPQQQVHPGQPPAAPVDWQQQQYMQQMQQQQHHQQYAAPPTGQYSQYAPVPSGHPEPQQY